MPENISNHPIRVLIVDDEEDDFILTSAHIRDITSGNFNIEWCSTYKNAIERIKKSDHDIYFIDYRLGARRAEGHARPESGAIRKGGVGHADAKAQ